MMKKIRKYARFTPIDVRIYSISGVVSPLPAPVYALTRTNGKNFTRFALHDSAAFVHASHLFDSLRILRLIGAKGPAIGDCVTAEAYRGQNIYPAMINKIAAGALTTGEKEVFIIVNSDNAASIRGIEKAGFSLRAEIRATRWLLFYFNAKIREYK